MIKTEVADVVVIGGGGAGLTAAISAAQVGAEVILLEKMPALGGSTGLSIGSITSPCTPWQRRAAVEDSVESFIEDLALMRKGRPTGDQPELTELLAREAPITMRWLNEIGVSFVGPFPEPPNRVPRMHIVVPTSRSYILALSRKARQHGVRVLTNVRADRFIKTNDRIIGVEVTHHNDQTIEVRSRKGIVLATGDFSNSPDLKSRYLHAKAGDIPAVNPASTGDGHRMVMELGGEILSADIATAQIRFPPPPRAPLLQRLPMNLTVGKVLSLLARYAPPRLFRAIARQTLVARMAPDAALYQAGAILINKNGERFADEITHSIYDVAIQPDQQAFMIVDANIVEQFSSAPHFVSTAPGIAYAYFPDYFRGRPDVVWKGDTLEALASALGVQPDNLARSVREYNASDRAPQRAPLVSPPFYALGPLTPTFVLTEGSMRIDGRCRVLQANGKVIPGLWAAGSVGQGGQILGAHGLHILWALTSGRVAGLGAATQHA